jgi:cytochrome P450
VSTAAVTPVTELDPPELPYDDPTLRGPRFHEVLGDLRQSGWLAKVPLGYAVLDRESAAFFLRTRSATFPGLKIAEIFQIDEGPLAEEIRRNILHLNGEDHSRLRNLVNPSFTPRAANRWRPAMREVLEGLWAQLGGANSCEFVDTFAKAYPSMVIATVMGAPLEDAPRLHHWSDWIQRQFDATALMEQRPQIDEAVQEFYDWAAELLERRRDDPREDLISTLLAARYEGDRLDDDELINLVLNVLVGGVDTTQSQLAQAMRLFAEHPEQWEALRADPELASAAVWEALRLEPITPFTARIALEDIEFRDVLFPEGTVVMVAAASANRDGVDARFDITAQRDVGKPLTFGAGPHYCLGANLAQAEMQEGLRFYAERMPGLALDGEPEFGSVQGVYGLDRLPLRWD